MWCVELILKFINRNAYILVASKGMSYCTAAGEAVALIIKNALRLLAVNVVGDSLIWLGKLGVAAGGGIVAFLMANTR
jgi:choline transporter-like protein 2/4/5